MLDNSDFDEKQTTKKLEALGFEVPGRKVYQPTSDGKPESFNIQVVRSTSNPNEPLTCTKDQASASLVDTSTVGRITSYDQVARAMSKDPVDASVRRTLVPFLCTQHLTSLPTALQESLHDSVPGRHSPGSPWHG